MKILDLLSDRKINFFGNQTDNQFMTFNNKKKDELQMNCEKERQVFLEKVNIIYEN